MIYLLVVYAAVFGYLLARETSLQGLLPSPNRVYILVRSGPRIQPVKGRWGNAAGGNRTITTSTGPVTIPVGGRLVVYRLGFFAREQVAVVNADLPERLIYGKPVYLVTSGSTVVSSPVDGRLLGDMSLVSELVRSNLVERGLKSISAGVPAIAIVAVMALAVAGVVAWQTGALDQFLGLAPPVTTPPNVTTGVP